MKCGYCHKIIGNHNMRVAMWDDDNNPYHPSCWNKVIWKCLTEAAQEEKE